MNNKIEIWKPDITRYIEEYGAEPFFIHQLVDYAEKRIPLGDCLTGLLENDLRKFVAHAGKAPLADLDNLFKFVYNVLPGNCWGSPAKVNRWLNGTEEY